MPSISSCVSAGAGIVRVEGEVAVGSENPPQRLYQAEGCNRRSLLFDPSVSVNTSALAAQLRVCPRVSPLCVLVRSKSCDLSSSCWRRRRPGQ